MHRVPCIAALLLLVGCLPTNAGTVVFSNLGQPGDTYGPDGISFGANPFFPPSSNVGVVATRFHTGTDSALEQVETAVVLMSGPVDLTAYLISELDGLPDRVIEAVHVTDINSGQQGALLTPIVFSAHTLLLSGTAYWFGLSAGPETFASWLFTPFYGLPVGTSNFGIGRISGDMTSYWNIGTGGPLGREGAFRVTADAVPEPSSWIPLLGLGTVAVTRYVGRRSKHGC